MPDEVFRWFVAGGILLAVISSLVQTGIFIALYRVAKIGVDKGTKLADRAEPILESTARVLRENEPKINEIGDKAVQIARSARESASAISDRMNHAMDAAQRAVQKADEGIDRAVEKAEHAAGAAKSAVAKPVREAHGVVNGVRAAISAYRRGGHDGNGDVGRAA